jgi:MoaA/NifB/PqqE/SkfB family radical SAM enzyme
MAQRIHDAVVSSGVLKHTMILEVSGGGDPIASPLFWSLLTDKLEHHPGMKVDLKTNGLLVTPERLAAIRAAGRIINCINISVDAACEATYAINRGGDWWRLMSNMEAIRDYPCWRQWNFVVQANNFREMADFVRLSSVYKVGTLFFSALDNWGSYTDEDYRSRAVHLPGHPEHQEFLDRLSDSVFWDERIIMAKIPLYRQGHVHDHRTSDAHFKPAAK